MDLFSRQNHTGGVIFDPVFGHCHETRQDGRHLNPSKVFFAGVGVAHNYRQVQRQPSDVWERVRWVYCQRRQDRKHLVAEVAVQDFVMGFVQAIPVGDDQTSFIQGRANLVLEITVDVTGHLMRATADFALQLTRRQPRSGHCREPSGDAALQTRDTHHIELVQVGTIDSQEPRPLQQVQAGVLGLLKHALVKGQPGQLSVGEASFG